MKTKITVLVYFILFMGNHLYSQQTALFHAVIRFEDAAGNKDSVTVGYDPDATYGIDPQFGEIEIIAPFDSVLEVRAMSPDGGQSKVIIQGTELIIGPNCHAGGLLINIFVWSKFQPVRVTWDSALFLNEECARGSFISNHEIDELTGPFSPDNFPPVCVCMASQGSYTFELTEEALLAQYAALGFDESVAVTIESEVEGLGLQTIYGLRFKPNDTGGYTPCYWITDTEEAYITPLEIYPNPSSGLIKIAGAGTFKKLDIFDATGRLAHSIPVMSNAEANLSGLPDGIYQLQASDQDGKRYMGRVVKQ